VVRFFGWGAKIERLFSWGSKNWWKTNQDNQIQSI